MADGDAVNSTAIIVINSPMCEDLGCPSRKNCFRHGAAGRIPRSVAQPYFAEPTRDPEAISCPWYWPLKVEGIRLPKVRRVTTVKQYTVKNDPGQIKTFITIGEVASMLGVRPSTIAKWSKRPDINFPEPLKLGNKNKHWVRLEVEDFLKSDENRGVGLRGAQHRHWMGATPEHPAWPWHYGEEE
jgi:predicted DNA-binding transcriptional regulator AlpA